MFWYILSISCTRFPDDNNVYDISRIWKMCKETEQALELINSPNQIKVRKYTGPCHKYEWEYEENGEKIIVYGSLGKLNLKFKNEKEREYLANQQRFVINWADYYDYLVTEDLPKLVNTIKDEIKNKRATKTLLEKILNVVEFFKFFDVQEWVKNVEDNEDYNHVLRFHQYIHDKASGINDEVYKEFKAEYKKQYGNQPIRQEILLIRSKINETDEILEIVMGKLEDAIKLNNMILEILKR
ncbi:uncharacterized protein VNE69_09028 [Vairimorpha necatrix]|uniref:Uncharacterized protein n=1 Tax=Vairimorpha necatrix TaxID=6039 RepID=A0AAX4JEQ3_9MICR